MKEPTILYFYRCSCGRCGRAQRFERRAVAQGEAHLRNGEYCHRAGAEYSISVWAAAPLDGAPTPKRSG